MPDHVGVVPDYTTLLAAALPLPGDEVSALLRLSNAQTRSLNDVQSALPPSPALRDNERKVVLYQTGRRPGGGPCCWPGRGTDRSEIPEWAGLYSLPDEWEIPVFPVKGADVVAAGVKGGPLVGETLTALEDWWIAGGFMASRDELLARLTA